MQLRTVALVGLLGVTLGWAVGTRVQPGQPTDPALARSSSGPRPLGTAPTANPAALTEQLRLKLERKPRAPRTSRNPFVFGSGRPAAARAAVEIPAPAAPAATPDPPAPVPEPGADLRLTGLASTAVDGGLEWTAMVHDGHSLLFAKRGDRLPGGFEVVDIQEGAVTIRDSAGVERTLRLR